MFSSMGPTSRAPVVAGFRVSGSSAQPTVRFPPLVAAPLAELPPELVPELEPHAAASAHTEVMPRMAVRPRRIFIKGIVSSCSSLSSITFPDRSASAEGRVQLIAQAVADKVHADHEKCQ